MNLTAIRDVAEQIVTAGKLLRKTGKIFMGADIIEKAETILRAVDDAEKPCPVCSSRVDIVYSPKNDLYPYRAKHCPECGRPLETGCGRKIERGMQG